MRSERWVEDKMWWDFVCLVKDLDFIMSVMGKYWKDLSRGKV